MTADSDLSNFQSTQLQLQMTQRAQEISYHESPFNIILSFQTTQNFVETSNIYEVNDDFKHPKHLHFTKVTQFCN